VALGGLESTGVQSRDLLRSVLVWIGRHEIFLVVWVVGTLLGVDLPIPASTHLLGAVVAHRGERSMNLGLDTCTTESSSSISSMDDMASLMTSSTPSPSPHNNLSFFPVPFPCSQSLSLALLLRGSSAVQIAPKFAARPNQNILPLSATRRPWPIHDSAFD
jgi:hypothetical protein